MFHYENGCRRRKKQTHENIIKNKKLLTYVFAVSIDVNLEGKKKKVIKSNLNYYYI